ncbi:MAG: GntR family transcriptional regulator [Candidatus Wallbacteria bacterium]|nr:GntR family transcriptional regulator [Candidatus Wallbacteria bacterium]
MNLNVNFNDKLPIYQQIINQIIFRIVSGELAPGDEISSVRKLAESLVINPNTISKAYYQLEMMGLAEKRRGMGTYVTTSAVEIARGLGTDIILSSIDSLLQESSTLRIPLDDLVLLIRKRASKLKGGLHD